MRARPSTIPILQHLHRHPQYLVLLLVPLLLVLVLVRRTMIEPQRPISTPPAPPPVDDAALFWNHARNVGADAAIRPATGREFVRGNAGQRAVALTFDDGPNPTTTPQVLAVLKWYRVQATFFLIGKHVDAHPALVNAIVAEGHQLGNHSYHHDRLVYLTPSDFRREVRDCSDAIARVTGSPPHLFRPPGGRFDAPVTRAAEQEGCRTVLWTLNPGDFRRLKAATIETRVIKGVKNGSVILLHEGVMPTVDALPTIIEDLQARGYRFVTIDELMSSVTD